MISGVRPPIIDEQGLVAAIEFLINERAGRGVKIEFHPRVRFQRLEPIVEGTMFRIVQEAISNIFRHSQAKLAQITLTHDQDRLGLVIEDWGIGFDPLRIRGRQFGLHGIRAPGCSAAPPPSTPRPA